jgi:glycosyltransferase involved in cell wall biosynthesis
MKYNIAIFCPDEHMLYDVQTLNQKGAGGGVTARVRIAHALAAEGHTVSLFVNCPGENIIEGVHYQHWTKPKKIAADIFIVSTSGGGMDLTCLKQVEVNAQLKILFVHGISQPKGLNDFPFDYIYAPSNFIQRTILSQWGTNKRKVFVSHHGVEENFFSRNGNNSLDRDPYAILYAGHPSKGLDPALSILHILREKEERFTLHIYGGTQLWGEEEKYFPDEPGVRYHGLVGQEELALKFQGCEFSLGLQSRAEPFGMVIAESMRAGCIVLVSPVGAYPEIIRDGYDGFLVSGNPDEVKTHEYTAGLIENLINFPGYMQYIRKNAESSPLSWETVARVWEGHWNWLFDNERKRPASYPQFSHIHSDCDGGWLPLADGLHCMGCGCYKKSLV